MTFSKLFEKGISNESKRVSNVKQSQINVGIVKMREISMFFKG